VNELSILIADDNEDFCEVLENYIHSAQPKSNVKLVENGYLAQVELRTNKYDLLITDFSMPVVNGLDLIRYVKTLRASQRPKEILLLSAYIEDGEPDEELKNIIFMPKENYNDDLRPLLKSIKDNLFIDNGQINITRMGIEGGADYIVTNDNIHVDIIGDNFVEMVKAKGISKSGLIIYTTGLLKTIPEGKPIDCLLSFANEPSMKIVAKLGARGGVDEELLAVEFTEISEYHKKMLNKFISQLKSQAS
jgi:CheY-like chemotaxis protein